MNFNIRKWLGEHYRPRPNLLLFLLSDASGVAMRIIRDMEAKSLVIFDICSFAEVLEQPLSLAWGEIPVYTELTLQLLRALSRKKPLTRNEGTWLAFQVAYLQALESVLKIEIHLQKSWLDRAMFENNGVVGIAWDTPFRLENARLTAILKTLYPGKLTDTQAEQALELLSESLLAQQMQNAAIAWLTANGAEEMEAKLITQRVAIALPGHLLAVVAENAAALAQLQKFLRLGNVHPQIAVNHGVVRSKSASTPTFAVGDWIDPSREYYRAQLIQDIALPLFGEYFALPDLYVFPKGLPIAEAGTSTPLPLKPVDLLTWLLEQLEESHTVTWIESAPGGGKTSFVKMFAAHVARKIYPEWMPIVVRLRDVSPGTDLIETICSGFNRRVGEHISTWLELEHLRCVVLLDGLDELPSRERQVLITQLSHFHTQSLHKFVITARSGEFEKLEQTINLLSLRRIVVQPFHHEEWREWFQNWSKVQSLHIAQSFFGFLKAAGTFASVSSGQCLLPQLVVLASQPLMLYVLAVLHRDGLLDEMLLRTASATGKYRSGFFLWELSTRWQRWVLGYPDSGSIKTILMREGMAHIHRTPEAIAKLYQHIQPRQLNDLINQFALQNWRSQRHLITNIAPEQQLSLPGFIFQNPPRQSDKLEFIHPYLEKLVTARAIARELIVSIRLHSQPHFDGDRQSLHSYAQFLYNLFGSSVFDIQFQELMIETLRREATRHGIMGILREKLKDFWYEYQRSSWLDMGIAHRALEQYQKLGNPTKIELINACVGVNVFFLLSTLHYETKTMFFPGGIPNTSEFNPEAIAELIARTHSIGGNIFSDRTFPDALMAVDLSHMNLSRTHLTFAHFNDVNLSNANLAYTNLTGVNFTGADLTNTNLTGANLSGVNLTGTNLIGANLTGANLSEVMFDDTNLTNACLCNAILSQRDQEIARLRGAIFSTADFQAIKRLLSQHELSSYASQYDENNTSMWMSHISGIGAIETSEGEIDSEEYEEAEDETVANSYRHEA